MRLNHQRGFTLIELMMVIVVFGFILAASADLLVQVVQSNNRIAIENEVRQNGTKILQDIVSSGRKSQCLYFNQETSQTALLRMSDSTTDPTCSLGNRTEYYGAANGILRKSATSSAGVQISSGIVNSAMVVVLNCVAAGSACGSLTCTSGLTVTGVDPTTHLLPTGAAASVSLWLQQQPSMTRSDFCAAVQLSDSVAPRRP